MQAWPRPSTRPRRPRSDDARSPASRAGAPGRATSGGRPSRSAAAGAASGTPGPSHGPRGPRASALSPRRPCPHGKLAPPSRTDRCGGSGRIRRRPVRVCAAGWPSAIRGAPCLPPHQMWRGPPGRSARPCGLGTGRPEGLPSVAADPRRSAALWAASGPRGSGRWRRGTAAGGPWPTPPIGSVRLEAKRLVLPGIASRWLGVRFRIPGPMTVVPLARETPQCTGSFSHFPEAEAPMGPLLQASRASTAAHAHPSPGRWPGRSPSPGRLE